MWADFYNNISLYNEEENGKDEDRKNKINKIVDLLKTALNKNKIIQFISPQFLMRKFDLSAEEAVSVCMALQKEGMLKPRYTLRCPNCARVLGRYETFNQIPEGEECMYCGEEGIERAENTYINFEIVRSHQVKKIN